MQNRSQITIVGAILKHRAVLYMCGVIICVTAPEHTPALYSVAQAQAVLLHALHLNPSIVPVHVPIGPRYARHTEAQ